MHYVWLNPAVGSENAGDDIIADAVGSVLRDLLPDRYVIQMPTQFAVGSRQSTVVGNAEFAVLGGTNLLSSNMWRYRQWKIAYRDIARWNNVIAMGVGWWQYQSSPDWITAYALRSVLHKNVLNSVRDAYTENMLRSCGIRNVVNTGCPTMWKLGARHCERIPHGKAESVVFTLTDYNVNRGSDTALIEVLLKNYKEVFFWPQGVGDLQYFLSLGVPEVVVLGGGVGCFDELLLSDIDVDYVGTRLHGGIRALQKGRRALILAVDNRAVEIGRDTFLPVVDRRDVAQVECWICNSAPTKIVLNDSAISSWYSSVQSLLC
jgi:polysaccharide pyruvyl transferase WcaK-like protein